METALAKAFRIAKEWNAILLLDEADVFLSKRSGDNLQKNAFVSVFLRLMEYYQGILFLTTNRAEDFDPAFMSRIHLVIDYKPLTVARRARIWENLSSNMRKDETMNRSGYRALAKDFNINGREIKNLLRTAWSLAKQDNEALSISHVRTVANIGQREGITRYLEPEQYASAEEDAIEEEPVKKGGVKKVGFKNVGVAESDDKKDGGEEDDDKGD
jgi:SpoVK/Ycf46/Vps4 family AAA+-type ATPase